MDIIVTDELYCNEDSETAQTFLKLVIVLQVNCCR